MCKISTDKETNWKGEEDLPDYAELVARLTRYGPSRIEYVRLEHPSGEVLTLGAKTSAAGRHLRFRHVPFDGVIYCTKRVAEQRKLVSQLADFYATGARGNHFAWLPIKSFTFDAEEWEMHSGIIPPAAAPRPLDFSEKDWVNPDYPPNIQGATQVPQRISQQKSRESRFVFIGYIVLGVLFAFRWYQEHSVNAERERAETAARAAARAEAERRHTEELNKNIREHTFSQSRSSTSEYTPSTTRSTPSGYTSPLGNIWPGTALYHKDSLTPFGFVVDVQGGDVWVADSYSIGASRTSLYARSYSRGYITANFLTK